MREATDREAIDSHTIDREAIREAVDRLLGRVSKPARYLGNEWNSVHKDHGSVRIRFALAFPDVYEVGMSNLGCAIIYDGINRREDALAERVYAPWVDMEAAMREQGIPLFALESHRPVREFDILGFSLPYETCYTNILNMLDLAGIPLRQAERGDGDPLVIAGGATACNAEPLAEFVDLFVLGDGEEVIQEILDAYRAWADEGRPGGRAALIARMAAIPGVYVPSYYDVSYDAEGWIERIGLNERGRRAGAAARPARRVVLDLDRVQAPTRPIVPWSEVVFDRMMVEVFRGCTRGCRFCHAGMVYRPVRERSPEKVKELARELVRNTGHQELSLVSLATNDYGGVRDVLCSLAEDLAAEGVNVSLPSLRVDAYSVGLADQVARVRKSGLTLAPEAGTQRLRDVINKGVSENDYVGALTAAYRAGWDRVKLYFMIGLPTERDEDLEGIARMAHQAVDLHRPFRGKGRKPVTVTVSVSSFVPKPHTPFQWEPQVESGELRRRQRLLGALLRHRNIRFHRNEPEVSFIEAALSRGDRRLGRVVERAWRRGCRFDAWGEQFKHGEWLAAFAEEGLDPRWYAHRCFDYEDVLPWEHIDTGIRKGFLVAEHRAALEAAAHDDCRWDRCKLCGICLDRPGVRPRLKPGDRVKRPKGPC